MLVQCPRVWGNTTVINAPPTVEEHEDVLYSPFTETYFAVDSRWGVYARSNELVEAAALRIGPERTLVGQSQSTDLNFQDSTEAPDNLYIYGGPFIFHYGHYICSTLSRLWYIAKTTPKAKILFHSHYDVASMLKIPHVRACFQRLGLSLDNVVVFNKPTRIKRLIIPGPSFEEQSFVHPEYRELCYFIGKDYIDDEAATPAPPVYLTKTGLSVGVGRVANEEVIEAFLRARGVEIIRPELLSWPQQVRLFSQRRVIVGTTGSAFHTSIFSPSRGRFVCLNTTDSVNSNVILMDKINGNKSLYLYPQSGFDYQSNVDDFLTLATMAEPEAVARELYAIIEVEDRILRPPSSDNSDEGSRKRPIGKAPAYLDAVGVDKLDFATRNTMRTQIERYGWSVGAHTYGTPDVLEPEYGPLRIGRFCSISAKVTLILGNHRTDTVSTYPFKALSGLWPGAEHAAADHEGRGGVEIGNDVWIGVGAIILPGARIGNGCVVRANAVVDGVVPDYTIVAGNPATVIQMRFSEVIVRRLLEIAWWEWDEVTLTRFMPALASANIEVFLRAVEKGEP